MKNISSKIATTCLALAALTAAASAQVTNLKEALDAALKNSTIAAAEGKMKLYAASASKSGANPYWSFQFYDGGTNVHSVSINGKGKVNYSTRDKGSSTRVFEDLDITQLPAPNDILVEGAMEKSKAALEALGFKLTNSGNYQISYYLRSEFRQKDKASHEFRVSLPIGDGKQGKTVGFKNGNIDTIANSSVRD